MIIMRQKKIFWQIFPALIAVVAVSLAVVLYFSAKEIRKLGIEQKRQHFETIATVVAERVSHMPAGDIQSYCEQMGETIGSRITIINRKGDVIGDTNKNPRFMDNHISRKEVAQAFKGQTSSAVRFSDTTKQTMLYVAMPIKDDTGNIVAVFRVAVSIESVNELIDSVTDSVITAVIITALAAVAVSFFISKRISKPIAALREGAKRFTRGELDYKLKADGSYETSSLANTMNNMAIELDRRIKHITEQQATQNTILSSMTEAVIAVDNRRNVIMANNAAVELFDMPQDFLGKKLEEVARQPQLQNIITDMLSKGNANINAEMTIFRQDNQVALQVNATLLKMDALQIGVMVVLTNVTRIKRLENLRKEFVANVSHELKTPITSIRGFVETLSDGAIDDTENARKFLEIIARQTSRLEAIIDDLLTLSRIERLGDNSELEIMTAFIKPPLTAAISVCQVLAADKNITVDLICDEKLQARFNPSLLEQAVINLVDNAVKYSQNGAKVMVAAEIKGDFVLISVKDFGCGIPEEDLDRIFERFYRVDKARDRQCGGTGLGLAIVKHVVNALRGSIKVESTLGKGSEFTIKLPR